MKKMSELCTHYMGYIVFWIIDDEKFYDFDKGESKKDRKNMKELKMMREKGAQGKSTLLQCLIFPRSKFPIKTSWLRLLAPWGKLGTSPSHTHTLMLRTTFLYNLYNTWHTERNARSNHQISVCVVRVKWNKGRKNNRKKKIKKIQQHKE